MVYKGTGWYEYLVILHTEYTKITSTLGITLIRWQKLTAQSGLWKTGIRSSSTQQSQLTANKEGRGEEESVRPDARHNLSDMKATLLFVTLVVAGALASASVLDNAVEEDALGTNPDTPDDDEGESFPEEEEPKRRNPFAQMFPQFEQTVVSEIETGKRMHFSSRACPLTSFIS